MAGDLYLAGVRTTQSEHLANARRIAADMVSRGVGANDSVALLLRNDTMMYALMEACRLVGVRFALINWHAAPKEVKYIVEDSQSKILYGHSDLLQPVMSELSADLPVVAFPVPECIQLSYGVDNRSPAGTISLTKLLASTDQYEREAQKLRGMFAYTSGSTGRPKGIKRAFNEDGPDRWDAFLGLCRNLMGAQDGDRFYVSAPLYHSAPNTLSSFCLAAGDVDIFVDPKFDPEGFLQTVEKFGITHAYIVPTMCIRLLKLPKEVREKYDVSSLRFTISTGSPWPIEVKNEMIDWFGPILNESYGASEIGFMTLISSDEAKAKPGSVGKILPGGTVKVLDDDFNEVPTGEVGTLYIHLLTYGDFEYTNQDGNLDGQRQGNLSTVGDMGYVDADGYIFISDRKKDMIISGGANIFPAEIEAELILMPEIADCAVFGAPDPEFGESIVAAVTCQPDKSVTLQDVKAWLEPRLAKFKIPRKLDVHDELPRQDSGKIFKAKLRAPYWEEAGRKV